ncbi:LysR family transcriptional regulator, partial [Escherichia coli]|nr:LysR family transcriptional regulator [Escherichia coli]
NFIYYLDNQKLDTIGLSDMFTIEQLQAFIATSEAGSFSGAARKRGRAQSVVSQYIMNMEIDCGGELFER